MNRSLATAVVGVLATALAGCGHVPLTTIYRLRAFNITTADPEVLRAAVRLPDVLSPTQSGVKLTVSAGRGAEADRQVYELVLKEVTEPAELGPLASERRTGNHIHVYRIDPADVPRIRAAQAEALRNPGKGGTLAVKAAACRRGDLPAGAILTTTYIKIDEEHGFMPLLKDVDIRAEVPRGEDISEKVLMCETFTNGAASLSAPAPKAGR
jgi:hypothetical protein